MLVCAVCSLFPIDHVRNFGLAHAMKLANLAADLGRDALRRLIFIQREFHLHVNVGSPH